jgi:thiol-disulfide isomerase/thioredoxin
LSLSPINTIRFKINIMQPATISTSKRQYIHKPSLALCFFILSLFHFFILPSSLYSQESQKLTIPKTLLHDWFDAQTAEWLVSFDTARVVYKCDFWKYKSISKAKSGYRIVIEKTDTVCGFDARGNYVCTLKKRETAFTVNESGGNSFIQINKKPKIQCVSDISKAKYIPKSELVFNSKPGIAVLRGQFLNMPNDMSKTITIHVQDFLFASRLDYSGNIAPDGTFTIKVKLPCAQEVYMSILNQCYLIPNDTLWLKIDFKIQNLNGINWMGKAWEINRDIRGHHMYTHQKKVANYMEKFIALSPDSFKRELKKMYEIKKSEVSDYSTDNAASPAFKTFTNIDFEVSYYNDLLRYDLLHARLTNKRMPSTYFSFIDSFDVTNKRFWVSPNFQAILDEIRSKYISFSSFSVPDKQYFDQLFKIAGTDLTRADREVISLKQRNGYYFNKINNAFTTAFPKGYFGWLPSDSTAFKKHVSKIKETDSTLTLSQRLSLDTAAFVLDGETSLKMRFPEKKIFPKEAADALLKNAFKKIDTLKYKEFLKTILAFHQLSSNIEHIDTVNIRVYKEIITQLTFEQVYKDHAFKIADEAVEKTKKSFSINCNIAELPKGSGDELLAQLVQKYKGKVLYIDVWATWCGPCLNQMELVKPIKEQLKDKNVVFVYLCGRSEKPNWENTLKAKEIKGEHYFLTDQQYNDMISKFEIKGIPHFVIVDKTGKVVDSNAPRPIQKEELVRELNKYLK